MSHGAPRAALLYRALLTILLVLRLVIASQERRQPQGFEQSLHEGHLAAVLRGQSPGPHRQPGGSPDKHGQCKASNSASAITTLAPAIPDGAVRAPPAG